MPSRQTVYYLQHIHYQHGVNHVPELTAMAVVRFAVAMMVTQFSPSELVNILDN